MSSRNTDDYTTSVDLRDMMRLVKRASYRGGGDLDDAFYILSLSAGNSEREDTSESDE